jgi:hypothetical protein
MRYSIHQEPIKNTEMMPIFEGREEFLRILYKNAKEIWKRLE